MREDKWTQDEELEWLASQAASSSVIVELGEWQGRSTQAMCRSTFGTVFGVDCWPGGSSYQLAGDEATRLAIKENCRDSLRPYLDSGGLVILEMDTVAAATFWAEHLQFFVLPDMIFIDADHTFEGVTNDIKAWLPLLRKGGLICGHDIDQFAVEQAVRKLRPDYLRPVKNIWAFPRVINQWR